MKGWIALHPFQEARLRALGLNGNQIIQGVATTDGDLGHPSKGSHDSVGAKDGRRWGWSIDVSVSYDPTREHFNALVTAGFCPFHRGPPVFSEHWHIVDVAWNKTDAGLVPRHLAIPRHQVLSFLQVPPRDGLISDLKLSAAWAPTAAQQAYIRGLWAQGVMPEGYDTAEPGLKVVYPPDAGAAGVVPCRPVMESGVTRCDLRPLAEALGYDVTFEAAQNKVYITPKT